MAFKSKFTAEQKARVVEAYISGQSSADVARALGCTTFMVRYWVQRAGHSTNPAQRRGLRPLTDDIHPLILRLHADGATVRQISAATNCAYGAVCSFLRRAGADLMATQGRAKRLFDAATAAAITASYTAGVSMSSIANDRGCSLYPIKTALRAAGVPIRSRHASMGLLFTDRRGRQYCLKSTWEVQTALWLDAQRATWDYEVTSYRLADGRTYTPDFWIYTPSGDLRAVVDVKGFLRPKQARVISGFRIARKDVPLEIWDEATLRSRGILDLPVPSLQMIGRTTRINSDTGARMVSLYESGATVQEIAHQTAHGPRVVTRHLRQAGIIRSSQATKRARSGHNDDWLQRMVDLRRKRTPMKEISRLLGVHIGTVCYHMTEWTRRTGEHFPAYTRGRRSYRVSGP